MNQDRNGDGLWGAIHRLEVGVKNSQEDIRKLFLHSARHEIALETFRQEVAERFDKIDKRFEQQDVAIESLRQETSERFDKVEETLAIIVAHLKK